MSAGPYETDEQVAAVCRPTDSHAPSVPGSTREYCQFCAVEVWLSPATRMVSPNLMIVCVECTPGVMAAHGETQLMPPTARQLSEIEPW